MRLSLVLISEIRRLEMVDQLNARIDVSAPRRGDAELVEQLPPGSTNRSDIGTWWPSAISVEWIRFFRIERCSTRCRRNRERSRSSSQRYARWVSARLIFGGEIRGHSAPEGRIGVVVVLRVKPAANQLCSQAGRPMQ